jgi:hypothetical protein
MNKRKSATKKQGTKKAVKKKASKIKYNTMGIKFSPYAKNILSLLMSLPPKK